MNRRATEHRPPRLRLRPTGVQPAGMEIGTEAGSGQQAQLQPRSAARNPVEAHSPPRPVPPTKPCALHPRGGVPPHCPRRGSAEAASMQKRRNPRTPRLGQRQTIRSGAESPRQPEAWLAQRRGGPLHRKWLLSIRQRRRPHPRHGPCRGGAQAPDLRVAPLLAPPPFLVLELRGQPSSCLRPLAGHRFRPDSMARAAPPALSHPAAPGPLPRPPGRKTAMPPRPAPLPLLPQECAAPLVHRRSRLPGPGRQAARLDQLDRFDGWRPGRRQWRVEPPQTPVFSPAQQRPWRPGAPGPRPGRALQRQ